MARSSTGTFAGALACALGGTGPRRRRRAVAALLGIVGVLGCGTDYVASAGPADPSQLLASVVLDHHAIVLSTTAPWNTIQLTTTPMSGAGAPLAGLPAATYSLSDSGSVAVSADGTVSALAPASGVLVIASVSAGNSTRKDTAYVTVVDTPTPPVLATFSIQPLPGDSAKMPAADVFQFFNHKQLTVQATDDQGAPIDALPAYFTSADRTTATVDPVTGIVSAIRAGTVTIRASTTAYGVTLRDSVVLTITPPLLALVTAVERTPVESSTPVLAFDPPTLVLSVGATVFFANTSADTARAIDVVFDDPADVTESWLAPGGAGNIAPFRSDAFPARMFPKAGTYTYHSTLYDTHGTIIVQ